MIHSFKRSTSYIRAAIFLLLLGAGSCPPNRSSLGSALSQTDPTRPEKKAVYILHGLNDSSDNPGLRSLAAAIQKELPQVDTYCVSMPNGKLIKERLAEARGFIDKTESNKKHDALFLVGYSLGGLLSADLATQWEKEKNIKGVVTINAPMGGIQLDVKGDLVSQFLVDLITSDLKSDKSVLQPDSSYLQQVRSGVEQSNIPLLSIGSRCKLSSEADTKLTKCNSAISTDGLRKNLTDTDMVLKLSSQLAVQHWKSSPKHIAVQPYENYAHSPKIFVNLIEELTNAPSILENAAMQKLVARFVADPAKVVKELNAPS